MKVELRLLGPLEVVSGGTPIEIGGGRERVLLVALALQVGRVVSSDQLIDVLWGDETPRDAGAALRTVVSRARGALVTATSDEVIVTRPPGYAMSAESVDVDVVQFEALVASGRAHLDAARYGVAAEQLATAVRLWHGSEIAEATSDRLRGDSARLAELRLTALEARIAADVALGRHDGVAAELEDLCRAQGLREQLWGLLMVVLYRCGRQADALRAYCDLRTALRDDLGIDPSRELRDLESAILAQDPALGMPTTFACAAPTLRAQPMARPAGLVADRPAVDRRRAVPLPRTSFVGRQEELDFLVAEIRRRRLVTLTGPGGVGKTRLAFAVAARAAADYPGGTWLVELARAKSADAVPGLVAEALGASHQPGMTVLDGIVDVLRGPPVLVVFDNAEHLLDVSAQLIEHIIAGCGELTVLVTSREPLGVDGERVWTVSPLDPVEGVELFRDRAGVTAGHAGDDPRSVEALCRRLDGMPLAIELAAARAHSMSPHDLLARLDDRFRLLRTPGRGRPERHRTLQAAIDWSYDLLRVEEQRVFDRLGIFPGSFDLLAVEQICDDRDLDTDDVDDVLSSLVDKSMVVPEATAAGIRYRLLESVRQYARDRLAGHPDEWARHDRHAAHYRHVAARARAEFEGSENTAGRIRFEHDWDNLRAAVSWATARHDGPGASAIVEASFWYAYWGLNHEHADWTDQILPLPDIGPPIHGIAGMWALIRGQTADALRHAEAGLERATAQDHVDTALCWLALACSLYYLGRVSGLRSAIDRWRLVADAIGTPWLVALSCANAANLLAELGDATAATNAERARWVAWPLHNDSIDAYVHWSNGSVSALERRFDDAIQWNRRAADAADRAGNHFVASTSALMTALHSRRSGQPLVAHRDSLRRLYHTRDWLNIWPLIQSLAELLVELDDVEAAGVLLGHLHVHRQSGYPANGARRDATIRELDRHPDAARWRARGAALNRHELIAFAFESLDSRLDPSPAGRARSERPAAPAANSSMPS